MKIVDYEVIHNPTYLYENKIVIYGIGEYGCKIVSLLSEIGIEIFCFIETTPSKNLFCNRKVLSLKEFLGNYGYQDTLVIIASENYYKEMMHNLEECKSIFVCTYYAVFVCLYLNYQKMSLDSKFKNKINSFLEASIDIAVHRFLSIENVFSIYREILFNSEKTLVYQSGKVGSRTICNSSLKTSHLHSIVCFLDTKKNKDMAKEILSALKKTPIKIITGVREPISRDISAFFQDSEINIYPLFRQYNGLLNLYGDYYKDLNQNLNYSTIKKRLCLWENSLNESFDKMCQIIMKNQADEFSWFDYEIKSLFDIDIFKYPFDKEQGFTIIRDKNLEILIYKCEKLNELEAVIREFIGDDTFRFCNTNEGKNKIYSYVYEEFKERVVINRSYFDYYYKNDKWMKHFYTELEIENFVKKWTNKLDNYRT